METYEDFEDLPWLEDVGGNIIINGIIVGPWKKIVDVKGLTSVWC